MKTNRRKTVRIVSFLSAIIIALVAWAGVSSFKLAQAKKELLSSNERALTQLGAHLDDISLNLQKCMYAQSSNMLNDVSSKLWRSSASAKENLSEITDGNTDVSGVYKFLSQVGEYTLTLNEKAMSNKGLSQEETENMGKLLSYSKALSNSVNELIAKEENGLVTFDEVKSYLQTDSPSQGSFGDELNDAAQSLDNYPTLIYDGPFSDHIQNKKSALLGSLEEVSQQKALEKAAKYLGVKENELLFLSKTDSTLATYNFYNSKCTVAVTQKGGIVCYMLSEAYAGEVTLSFEDALEKAQEHLADIGYENIKDNYYSVNDGICTINFVYYENGITYYTDLIKVSVALDDGRIVGFDASGYLMNHVKRDIPEKPKYTIEQGQKLLKADLKLLGSKKAFIPTQWETEVYCYEYHCKASDGNEILIYMDTQTGEEINILILLYGDGGILTR